MWPTPKQVAEEAGVSISTVSRFLKNEDRVSLEKRRKIEEAMRNLGF